MKRRISKKIKIGNVEIGGGSPISVQSMTKIDSTDVKGVLAQINKVHDAGGDIIRIAVPNQEAVESMDKIVKASPLPIIADIHFDYRLALGSLKAGVSGLRLNPGNIGSRDRVEQVVAEAKARAVPIRIGVNAGSLSKELQKAVDEGGLSLPQAMVESAKEHIKIFEDCGFDLIKISLKSSDVLNTIEAYKLLAKECDYPFHVGITEAGTLMQGTIKSSVGVGILLYEGLCDTIRVSLTAPPEEEIKVGRQILQSLGLKKGGPMIISCPTCGRTEIDIIGIAEQVEKALASETLPITVAVMGCIVNGPGEARHADIGIAGGKQEGLIFAKGQIIKKVPEDQLVNELLNEFEKLKKIL